MLLSILACSTFQRHTLTRRMRSRSAHRVCQPFSSYLKRYGKGLTRTDIHIYQILGLKHHGSLAYHTCVCRTVHRF